MNDAPPVDVARVIADLRELDRRTGGPGGARRVAWSETWHEARRFLGELLAEIGLEAESDAAGNQRAVLEGDSRAAVALGSHLDSVPAGGWLDGALGVIAAAGVIRAWAGCGRRPPRDLMLIDWADEEGSRFGHSLVGSQAATGSLDAGHLSGLRDEDGRPAGEVLAESGVELDRIADATGWIDELSAYLELHIEQGPVLESEDLALAAVEGCAGIERFRLRFEGQASHAGTTPIELRRDAGLAAAATALAIERIATERHGVGTTGELGLEPGIITAVPGGAELGVDLRHPEAEPLAAMTAAVRAAALAAAAERRCELSESPVWSIAPTGFDPGLVGLAAEACESASGSARILTSGALHDAASVAPLVPTAMIFCRSVAGLSHAPEENSTEADLTLAIEAFADLTARALET
ncbi:MAG: Zn-dependent hydrolase [Solirubrobacterales bacterium]